MDLPGTSAKGGNTPVSAGSLEDLDQLLESGYRGAWEENEPQQAASSLQRPSPSPVIGREVNPSVLIRKAKVRNCVAQGCRKPMSSKRHTYCLYGL